MKFYVHLETSDFTKKIVWKPENEDTILSLINKVLKSFNAKNPDHHLRVADIYLRNGREVLDNGSRVIDVIKNDDDIYIEMQTIHNGDPEMNLENVGPVKIKCGRNGCGMDYFEEENVDNCCRFHSGDPLFHEGLKGWTCCDKRVVDFDEMLKIPGCTYGRHIPDDNKKKKAPAKYNTSPSQESDVKFVEKKGEQEIFHEPSIPLSSPILKEEKEAPGFMIEDPDPLDAEIPIGTACTRNGCNAVFCGDVSRMEECQFHPGSALFHEGSKGWICCKPKTLLFDDFLRIEGCHFGRHKFIRTAKKESPGEVKCRFNWYQSQAIMNVEIYAKKLIQIFQRLIYLMIGLSYHSYYRILDWFLIKNLNLLGK